jgi:hypothetical protein
MARAAAEISADEVELGDAAAAGPAGDDERAGEATASRPRSG